jgi:heme/copper-type cytochrome/quinol oxidase subunit 2
MERPMHLPWRRIAALGFLGAATALVAHPAFAQQPVPWEMDMQPAFSPVKAQIISLHNLVMVIITLITIFVAGLLLYTSFRFSHKRNPVASRTSHNTVLEIAWTTIPVLILVIIAIPSFRLVYYEDRAVDPDMTLKVTGHQWYWHYAYPDAGSLQFDSYIVDDKDLKEGQRGRDPQLLHSEPGRAALCHSWPYHRNLGGDHQAGRLLRRVQPDLRHQPQPHADQHTRGAAGRVHRLACVGQDQVCDEPAGDSAGAACPGGRPECCVRFHFHASALNRAGNDNGQRHHPRRRSRTRA